MDQESVIWSMYFSGIVAFQFHPGCKHQLSIEQCAIVADEMLAEARKRWLGSQV